MSHCMAHHRADEKMRERLRSTRPWELDDYQGMDGTGPLMPRGVDNTQATQMTNLNEGSTVLKTKKMPRRIPSQQWRYTDGYFELQHADGLVLGIKAKTNEVNELVCKYSDVINNMYVCMYVLCTVCIYVSLNVCMYVCMYVSCTVCIYVSLNVCMYVCMYVYMYVCMYVLCTVCIYVSLNVCIYVSMYYVHYVSMYLDVCIMYTMYLCISERMYLCMYVLCTRCIYVSLSVCIYVSICMYLS